MLFFDPDGQDPILYGGPGSLSGPYARPSDGYNANGQEVWRVPLSNRYQTADGRWSETPLVIPTNEPRDGRNTGERGRGVGQRTSDQNVSPLTRGGAAVSALPLIAEGFNLGVNSLNINSALRECRGKYRRDRFIAGGCKACCVIYTTASRNSMGTFTINNVRSSLYWRSCEEISSWVQNPPNADDFPIRQIDSITAHTDPSASRIRPRGDWRYGTQYRDLSAEFRRRL
jgi:hypothetical protein